MRRAAAPITLATLALATGAYGWRLVPDTALYARRGLHLWPAPIGDLLGTAGGMWAVVIASGLAAGVVVAMVPAGAPRVLLLAGCGVWFLYPGVDALGVCGVLMFDRTRSLRWLVVAGLVHPVAGIVGTARLLRDDAEAVVGALTLSVVCIVAVSIADTFDTTLRYLAPSLALACVHLPWALRQREVNRA
jgi:hypothetical protein